MSTHTPLPDIPEELPEEPVAEIPCATLVEAISHLRVVLSWLCLPQDDQIIVGHIRDALLLLEAPYGTPVR